MLKKFRPAPDIMELVQIMFVISVQIAVVKRDFSLQKII